VQKFVHSAGPISINWSPTFSRPSRVRLTLPSSLPTPKPYHVLHQPLAMAPPPPPRRSPAAPTLSGKHLAISLLTSSLTQQQPVTLCSSPTQPAGRCGASSWTRRSTETSDPSSVRVPLSLNPGSDPGRISLIPSEGRSFLGGRACDGAA
jgi:hypothetical protein